MIDVKNGRNYIIDSAKGFAILFIIVSHTALQLPFSRYLTAGFIPIFFLLSGYTYSVKRNIREDVFRRGKSLLRPYFIYGFIVFFIFSIPLVIDEKMTEIFKGFIFLIYSRACYYNSYHDETLQFISNFYPFPQWFFTCMFLSYVPFLIYTRIKHYLIKILVFVALFISSLLFYYYSTVIPLLPWSIDTCFFFSQFLIIGYESKRIRMKLRSQSILLLIALPLYIQLIKMNGSINLSIAEHGNNFAFLYILSLLYSFIVICLLQITDFVVLHKFLGFLGENSMNLMFIHVPLAFVFNNFVIVLLLSIILCFIINKGKMNLHFKKFLP